MPRPPVFLALVFGLTAAPAVEAQGRQLADLVEAELLRYVRNVDVDSLSSTKLAAIYSIMHSRHTESEKRLLIRSALGGRHSLRGLIFRN